MFLTTGVIQIAVAPRLVISSSCALRPARSPPWKVPLAARSTLALFLGSPSAKRSTMAK
jgi:hypothetical protein